MTGVQTCALPIYPSALYGSWEGDLRLSAIARVATGVAGVRDASTVEPVANVAADDPAFPFDTTVYLITPKRVLAHREW